MPKGVILSFNPRDHYFKKAKQQKFVARSIFKLEEIDQKFKILKPGQVVLDLGASPGSWSQYASKKVAPSGKILGIDLKPVTVSLPNAEFLVNDILQMDWAQELEKRNLSSKVDIVLSDMAPNTTGIKSIDQAKSFELCEMALNIAILNLKNGGHFVCKLFHSDDFTTLRNKMRENFQRVEAIKPDSTRKISKEIFLIGLRFQAKRPKHNEDNK